MAEGTWPGRKTVPPSAPRLEPCSGPSVSPNRWTTASSLELRWWNRVVKLFFLPQGGEQKWSRSSSGDIKVRDLLSSLTMRVKERYIPPSEARESKSEIGMVWKVGGAALRMLRGWQRRRVGRAGSRLGRFIWSRRPLSLCNTRWWFVSPSPFVDPR